MTRGPLHAIAWLIWALAAAVCVQVAGNPLYVGLVVGICWVVTETHNAGGLLSRAFPVMVSVGAIFGAIKVGLTALTTHTTEGVLVTLPDVTLPELLGGFTVGGTVNDLIVARAVSEAIAIVGVMAAFGAFNSVVAHDELVRSMPRSLHEPGVMLTVGLAFVPSTIQSVRLVQESDRARTGGVSVRRGRLVRLTIPLLERGMERAVLLSESMDARGFARQKPSRQETWGMWTALGGLVSLLAMLVALVGGQGGVAVAALAVGVALIGLAVALGSRATTRTRYRPRRLTPRDALVMSTCLLATGGVIAASALGRSVQWPGTVLEPPGLDPVVVLALALLAVPALLPGTGSVPSSPQARYEAEETKERLPDGAGSGP